MNMFDQLDVRSRFMVNHVFPDSQSFGLSGRHRSSPEVDHILCNKITLYIISFMGVHRRYLELIRPRILKPNHAIVE